MATPDLAYVSPVEALRLRAGLTLTEACKRSGLAKRTMRNAEEIDWEPHGPTVIKLAALYEVDPGELLEDIRRYTIAREQRLAA